MSAGRTPSFDGRGVGTCARCGKVCYRSRREAKNAKRVMHPGEKMHAYECGSAWHVGHDDMWREVKPDDLIWRALPSRARQQMQSVARASTPTQPGGTR